MKRGWKRAAGAVVLPAALAYAGYAAFFYTAQRQLLFPLAGAPHPFQIVLTAPAQLVEVPVSYGRARGGAAPP